MQCDAVDSPNQIVITCTKQVVAVPPLIPPTIPTSRPVPTSIYTPSNGGSVSIAPNCLNGATLTNCTYNPVSWPASLSIRYQAGTVVSNQYFKFTGFHGDGVRAPFTASLSTVAGDYDGTCKVTSFPGSMPFLIMNSVSCPVQSNTIYYLNIKVTNPTDKFQIKVLKPGFMN